VKSLADTVRLRVSGASQARAPEVLATIHRILAGQRTTLHTAAPRHIEVVEHPTVEAYQRATGRAWWTAASMRHQSTVSVRIDIVPFETLMSAGRLEPVLRHELAHALTDAALEEAPRWAREGLAAVLAGEGQTGTAPPATACPADDALARPGSADAMRDLYLQAAGCVSRHLSSGASWRLLR
jgi:hypothetical protein